MQWCSNNELKIKMKSALHIQECICIIMSLLADETKLNLQQFNLIKKHYCILLNKRLHVTVDNQIGNNRSVVFLRFSVDEFFLFKLKFKDHANMILKFQNVIASCNVSESIYPFYNRFPVLVTET